MPAEDVTSLEFLFRSLELGCGLRPSFGSGDFATGIGPVCLYSLPEEHFILLRLLDFQA